MNVRKNLDEAIKLIPDAKKAAYLEAVKLAPHLVETESNPMYFLIYESFNYWAAALRITTYWEERKNVFGDRAFLPLMLIGKNALTEEVIQSLREGALTLLPHDSSGRSVIYCHSIFASLPIKERLQILFYIAFILMRNNPQSSKVGVVALVSKNKMSLTRDSGTIAKIARRAMPIRLHSLHFLCKHCTVENAMVTSLLAGCRWLTNQKAYIHLCTTPEERASKLSSFGLKKDRLVKFLGGSWEEVQWDGLAIDETKNNCRRFNKPSDNIDKNSNLEPETPHLVSRRMPQETEPISFVEHQSDRKIEDNMTAKGYVYVDSSSSLNVEVDRWPAMGDQKREQRIQRTQNTLPLPSDANASSDAMSSARSSSKRKMSRKEESVPQTRKRKKILHPEEIQSRKREPTSFDVLLGQGTRYTKHPGNRSLRRLIEVHSANYSACSLKDNLAPSMKGIRRVKQEVFDSIYPTGRFLKFDDDSRTWYEVTPDYALQKISQAFRNYRSGQEPASSTNPSTVFTTET